MGRRNEGKDVVRELVRGPWPSAASVCLREEGIIDGARLPNAGAHRPQRHYNGRRGEGAWRGVASRERAEAGLKIVSTRGVA